MDQAQEGAESEHPPIYAIRLRFRATKGFSTEDESVAFDLDGHEVRLASPDSQPLRKAGWFSLKATGFSTPEDAEAFGNRLKNAIQIASIRRFWGVDVGEGKATSAFFKGIVDSYAAEGIFVRPNLHGLDVYEDRPNTVWTAINMTGTVSINPEKLFGELNVLAKNVGEQEPPRFDAVRLLNEALMSQEAAAQLVLAIAAVELLAQGEDWTTAQKDAVKRLAEVAEKDAALSELERQELADAVGRMHRMGVLQGIKRLMTSLGLQGQWKQWRELYSKRSSLLHGLAYASPGDRSTMVYPTLALCSHIVLTALESDVPGATNDLDATIPLQAS